MSEVLPILRKFVDKAVAYVIPPQGKVYLVTGASKGIGKAIAFELAKQGKSLILVARTEKTLLEVQQDIVDKYKVPVISIPFDVVDFDGFQKVLKTAHSKIGPVDTIILNAGIATGHRVGKNGFAQDLTVLETNLLGPISEINDFVNYAKSVQIVNPHVVIITSVASDVSAKYLGAYCASKSGLSKYLESCALELEGKGFYFTNIQPGFITTDMIKGKVGLLGKVFSVTSEWCAKETVFAINRRQQQRYIPHWLYYPVCNLLINVVVLYDFLPFKRAFGSLYSPFNFHNQ